LNPKQTFVHLNESFCCCRRSSEVERRFNSKKRPSKS